MVKPASTSPQTLSPGTSENFRPAACPTGKKPRSGSLRLWIDAHFGAFDDDEWMTAEDVAEKWDVELSTSRRALDAMVVDGQLERFLVPSEKIRRQISAYRRPTKSLR